MCRRNNWKWVVLWMTMVKWSVLKRFGNLSSRNSAVLVESNKENQTSRVFTVNSLGIWWCRGNFQWKLDRNSKRISLEEAITGANADKFKFSFKFSNFIVLKLRWDPKLVQILSDYQFSHTIRQGDSHTWNGQTSYATCWFLFCYSFRFFSGCVFLSKE